ncbi:uncharacterized protein BX664DRAFT_330334 [Halteromyces radiatus]|uniref:uncharacterized protein n=1 Tax=Halteromyces radiatus TaxID=101107 RepID=UPI002220D900|nr:uncharacterized protein BX664DRAFT_330334 [Halteromyces radiatus]KAI8093691.1 hypothetical protein BX664DRAFT_330334 [Halteromyces radiatus]
MISWRKVLFVSTRLFHPEPLNIVSRHSPFFPVQSIRHASSSFTKQSIPELYRLQQAILQRRLDTARQKLALLNNKYTLDRFKIWRPLLLLARKGRHIRDLEWLQNMVEQQAMTHQYGLVPDHFDYHALMYCYGVHGDLDKAAQVMTLMKEQHDLSPTVFTYNTLLGCYQRMGAVEKAMALLSQLENNNNNRKKLLDTASYNTVLAMLDHAGKWERAISLYTSMPFSPDLYTKSTMLHIATEIKDRELGKMLYDQLRTTLYTTLFEKRPTHRKHHHHHRRHQQKPLLDIATINAMLAFQISVMNDVDGALELYHDLVTQKTMTGLVPDTITCNILLDGVLKQLQNPGKAAALYHRMETEGYLVPDSTTLGIMMDAEALMGNLAGALALFEEAIATIDEGELDRMMSSLATVAAKGNHDEATMEQLWTYLDQHSYALDSKAYNGLMHGLAKHGRADLAQTLYDRVFRHGTKAVADVATFTSLILAYIHGGHVNDAMEIYHVLRDQHDKQQERKRQGLQTQRQKPVIELDSIFYTSVISALTDTDDGLHSALDLFMDMRQLRIQPTKHIYTAMLHWCGQRRDADGLEQIHQLIKMDMALDPDMTIYNALMDGYNRTDQIDQVLYLWDTMTTTMMDVDATTVSIVLDACGHHGQTTRGHAIWQSLQRRHVNLNTNNYNSYVEFLCRAGGGSYEQRWNMACDVVQHMMKCRQPLPNAKTFNTLASFARKYGIDTKPMIMDKLHTIEMELRKKKIL